MGAGCSSPLPNLPNNNYMNISIFHSDTLVLLYPGKQEIEAVRNAILPTWLKGIQKEDYMFQEDANRNENCYRFKLSGYPFTSARDKETAVMSRLMAAAILKALLNLGWKLLCSSDLSRYMDLNSWFFQRQVVQTDPYQMWTIGLSSTDKLQINDCPDHLHDVIRQTCEEKWVNGIQNENKSGRTYEIKLNGNPWSWVNKSESCSSRNMIKEIVQRLSARQYDLYANSNLTGTADTLFFNYNANLQGQEEFLVVSLNRNDRIRILNAADFINSAVREAVVQHWPNGLQDEKHDENCFELKLRGHPWWADGQEAVYSRRLIVRIMERLASLGYFIITGLDMSRKDNDKSVLLFRKGAPLQTKFMCVSLNQTDKIRFIDAPQNVIEAGRSIIHYWPLGLDTETVKYDGVTYEAKMNGNPWESMVKGDGVHGRSILLGILCQFVSLGWRLVCSADVSAKYIHQDKGPDYPIDVHSWYFMYDEMMFSAAQAALAQPQQQLYPTLPTDNPPPYNPSYANPPPY